MKSGGGEGDAERVEGTEEQGRRAGGARKKEGEADKKKEEEVGVGEGCKGG